MPVIQIECLTHELRRDHRNNLFAFVLLVATVALVALSACGSMQLGVVGIDRRSDSGGEFQIVGPTSALDGADCAAPQSIDEPTSFAVVDHRCSTYVGQQR